MASGSKTVLYAALVGNALISVTKFAAGSMTGSSAMFSEGVHSLVDTGNQVLLLYGLKRAARPADEEFPFGHGAEVYFWSFVVSILIFAVGAGVSIYEGVHHILDPHPIENPLVNYVVLGLALVFEGFAWYFAYREFNKQKGELGYFEAVRGGKDPTNFVVLFEDSAAMLGLLVAGAGVALGQAFDMPLFDGLASIVIGAILAGTAVWLAYETKGLLIGESARGEVVRGIRRMTGDIAAIERVHEVLTLHMGPDFILVTISADFTASADSATVEQTIADLATSIKSRFPEVKRVFVSAVSDRPKSAAPLSP